MKVLRILHKLRKRFIRPKGTNRVYFPQRVAEYRRLWSAVSADNGCEFADLGPDTWQIARDGRRTRISNYMLEFDNPVVLQMAGSKTLMHGLLKEAGLPIPDHAVFTLEGIDRLYEFLATHPLGVVVKPAGGSAGLGVTTHVESAAEARDAAVLASVYEDELLVEAQVPGECYRLLVLDGKLLHAVRRTGVRVTGDGATSIAGLLAARRGGAGVATVADRNTLFTLASQGLSMASVPERGREILVKTIPDEDDSFRELRTVYDATVTDLICDEVRQVAETAVRVLGSEFAGVDIITMDPSRPLEAVGGAINEINTTPALHHHYDVRAERYPTIAVPILDRLLGSPRG